MKRKPTTQDIAQSAIDTAYHMLEANSMQADAHELSRALRQEIIRKGNVLSVTLVTPNGNAGAYGEKLQHILEDQLGRPVDMVQKADSSLIGGAILLFNDVRIDRSVRGLLSEAADHLRQSPSSAA